MLIILIIFSMIMIVWSICYDNEEYFFVFSISLGLKLIIITILLGCVINGKVIDKKIKLLEEKNKEIENKIEISVKTYMEYEGKTFSNLKSESYIQLVNLYPNLKSDKLIEKQISLYQKNIKEITDLKMEKINISNYKWWIYFGG